MALERLGPDLVDSRFVALRKDHHHQLKIRCPHHLLVSTRNIDLGSFQKENEYILSQNKFYVLLMHNNSKIDIEPKSLFKKVSPDFYEILYFLSFLPF